MLVLGEWRRGESNPRPKAIHERFYVRSSYFFSPGRLPYEQGPVGARQIDLVLGRPIGRQRSNQSDLFCALGTESDSPYFGRLALSCESVVCVVCRYIYRDYRGHRHLCTPRSIQHPRRNQCAPSCQRASPAYPRATPLRVTAEIPERYAPSSEASSSLPARERVVVTDRPPDRHDTCVGASSPRVAMSKTDSGPPARRTRTLPHRHTIFTDAG